jgi:hypothetical protein
MNFTLPEEGLQRLAAQLNLTGTFTHTLRSAYGGHQLLARVRIERGQPNTAVRIEMGEQVLLGVCGLHVEGVHLLAHLDAHGGVGLAALDAHAGQ